jgi:glycosyltransferase involved in cell wall biosynthesis
MASDRPVLVSVIMPTLNRSDYLSQCLSWLFAEINGRNDVEVIVVDDGSHGTARETNRALCSGHGARYIGMEKNRGMAVARNVGIRQARGEWIVFIDDDVCVEKGWGQTLFDLLSRVPADVAGIEGKVTGKGDGLWDREVQVLSPGSYLTCHIVYKKEMLLKAGCFDGQFEHEGPFHEDQELAVRVLQWGKVVFEPSLAAIHLPRKVGLLRYLKDAPQRIEKVLKADFYFFYKHPESYRNFRHETTFWGTYAAVLFKHAYVTCNRRTLRQLFLHPLQAVVLVVSCMIAQIRSWFLLPCFIYKAIRTKKPTAVWFAAAIPANSRGGVNRLMTGLSDGLRKKGIRTRVMYHDGTSKNAGYIDFSLRLMFRLLGTLFNPPEWIIARSTDAFFCALLRKILFIKSKIILHNHGWEEYVYEIQKRVPAALVEHPVTWKARLIRFPLLRATLAMADYCICGTIDDMRWIRNRYPARAAKLRYVPNGVEQKNECYWAARTEKPPDFLCVGTMTWRKNLVYAVELLSRLALMIPQARLFLIGTGTAPTGMSLDGQDRITLVPSVKMEEMERWYTQCPFFIHTARYEGGHSLALLEAMSYGAVAFVAPIPSSREIIGHGQSGILLCGTDAQKDAGTIAAVIRDREIVAVLGKKAYGVAMRNRWERQVARIERIVAKS